MKRTTMTLLGTAVVLAACGAAPRALGKAFDAAPLLYVAQDESTVERMIAEYMQRVAGVTASYRLKNGNSRDLILEYMLRPDGVPPIRLIIDTDASARSPSGEVLERVIHLVAVHPLPRSALSEVIANRLLALNNHWQQCYWVPHNIFVNEQGLLVMQTHLNIPRRDTPISVEAVRDLIYRMLVSWQQYYPRLEQVLSGEPAALGRHDAGQADTPARRSAATAAPRSNLWEARRRSGEADLNL